MRLLLLAAALLAAQSASAREDFSHLVGTYQVVFQPVQMAGVKTGCSFVYKAIAADHVYQQGRLVMLVGNITFSVISKTPMLSFKLGLRDPLSPSPVTSPPHIAYLQTAHGSTAQSVVDSGDLDGYRMFVLRFDEAVTKVMIDMIEGETVTLGFNRRQGGVDVLFPLDLQVQSAEILQAEVKRQRSPDALLHFADCVQELSSKITGKP